MNRWRPSPDEERWLAVTAELGPAIAPGALTERSGGWRSTGPLARIALFVLGYVAATLLLGLLGFDDETMLLVAGLVATLAAEWLTVQRRLHASGIEEGLGVAGFLMIGFWFTLVAAPGPVFSGGRIQMLVLIAVAGAAGLRRLNPFVTTCAAIALVFWVGSTAPVRSIDQSIGAGITTMTFGCAAAALALALGARHYRRPSHDRMLDWLVATLPVAACLQHAPWSYMTMGQFTPGVATGRLPAIAMLLALGLAMLVIGLRRRRHAPLLGALGCIACLAVELRLASSLATETWLILCGLAALVAGGVLERYLRQPRNGLTSVRLDSREGPLDLLQTAGAAVLAQRSAPEAPPPDSNYTPGGGKFGGGGASGSY